MISITSLRLTKKAQAIDESLVSLEQTITAVNTEGIIDGFKSVWLGVNTLIPTVYCIVLPIYLILWHPIL